MENATHVDMTLPTWTINHVAVFLHMGVDTAREHTYRSDFPAPKAPFAKNLWAAQGTAEGLVVTLTCPTSWFPLVVMSSQAETVSAGEASSYSIGVL